MIVDTYLKYVNGKKTVIFCASVDHAAEIAKLLRDNGVKAETVSGRDRVEIRDKILKDYETGSTNVLCTCDLLNEGWDSPHTTVLFMARPTMSKTIYTKKDVEKNILSNPFKRFEDMRFLMRCKDVETVEVNPIIFRKLTREDWLHIVDVCDKSLEKYYMRFKK